MKFQPELFIIIVHILLALVYSVFIFFGKSYLRKEQIIFVLFVPVFGILSGLIVELVNVLNKQGSRPVELEPLTLGEDILWVTLKSFHEKGDIVPLEEAILIDDMKVRRRFMLETLYADPLKYLDILNVAKYNDDIETSHYATTTISKVQRDFQLSVQKLAVDVEHHPENMEMLDHYIMVLGKYIKSGLLQEHLLNNFRLVYSAILDRKLRLAKYDKITLIEKLRNHIKLKEYVFAFETCDLLKKYYPKDEETWIEALRVCVDEKDAIRLQETIDEISRNDIDWTRQGRDQVSPWLKVMAK